MCAAVQRSTADRAPEFKQSDGLPHALSGIHDLAVASMALRGGSGNRPRRSDVSGSGGDEHLTCTFPDHIISKVAVKSSRRDQEMCMSQKLEGRRLGGRDMCTRGWVWFEGADNSIKGQ
jgi:hypothetical protein